MESVHTLENINESYNFEPINFKKAVDFYKTIEIVNYLSVKCCCGYELNKRAYKSILELKNMISDELKLRLQNLGLDHISNIVSFL